MKTEDNGAELLIQKPLVKEEIILALEEPKKLDALLKEIDKAAKSIPIDGTTEAGRKEIKSLAFKVSRTKTALDEIGKDHVAELKAKVKPLDAARKKMRDFLDSLKGEIRKPVDEYEAKEEARRQAHENAISRIESCGLVQVGTSLEEIKARIKEVNEFDPKSTEEFSGRATEVQLDSIKKLMAAKQAEDDRLEQAEAVRKAQEEQKKVEEENEKLRLEKESLQKAADQNQGKPESDPDPLRPLSSSPAPLVTPPTQPSKDEKSEYRATAHRTALACLMSETGLEDEELGKEIIGAIIKGKIPRIAFDYQGI